MSHLVPQDRSGEHGGAQAETGESAQPASRDGRPLQVYNDRFSWTIVTMTIMRRFMWVDKVGASNYFIIIATSLEDHNERSKPVLAWAVRKQVRESLREICLDVIRFYQHIRKSKSTFLLQRES